MPLTSDLINIILSYTTLKTMQRWVKQGLRTQLNLKQILHNRFDLTKEQQDSVWQPFKRQKLTEWENFCAFYVNSGEPSYEGQLYSLFDFFLPLLNAIKAKDIELLKYYIVRFINNPSPIGSARYDPTDYYDQILELYALRTNDIDTIILTNVICRLIGKSNFDLSIAKYEAFNHVDVIKKLYKYPISNIGSTILDDVNKGKTFNNLIDIEISNKYNKHKLQLELLIRGLPNDLSKLIKDGYNLIMPNVFPHMIVYSINSDELAFITNNTIDRAMAMKKLVLEHYLDSDFRREYITFLDILLGLDVTLDFTDFDPHSYNTFIFNLIVSVMHGQAFKQASHVISQMQNLPKGYCSEIIYDPTCLPTLSQNNLVSLVLTNKLLHGLNYKLVNTPIADLRHLIYTKTRNDLFDHLNKYTGRRGLIKDSLVVSIDELAHLPIIPQGLPILVTSMKCLQLLKNNYNPDYFYLVMDKGWLLTSCNVINTLSNIFSDKQYLFKDLLL